MSQPAVAATRPSRTGRLVVGRVVRGLGWVIVATATVILLFVVYLQWGTGLEAARAQHDLEAAWSPQLSSAVHRDQPTITTPDGPVGHDPVATADLPDTGESFARLWFERDGDRLLADEDLYVVQGVAAEQLRRGPGHYPDSVAPGQLGNVAIAGHRTTHGAPFWAINELRHGDTIHLVDTLGTEWTYRYVRQQLVGPSDTWVIGDDPLETAVATLTLTTCHPRHSAAQRLVVFAELHARQPTEASTAASASPA